MPRCFKIESLTRAKRGGGLSSFGISNIELKSVVFDLIVKTSVLGLLGLERDFHLKLLVLADRLLGFAAESCIRVVWRPRAKFARCIHNLMTPP
jgi:hypothetical protein